MFSSLWTTVKRFGISLHFRRSLYYILPSTWSRRSSHKNVYSFISRPSKRTPNQFDLLRYILCLAFLNWTVLLLTFTLSFISGLSLCFAAFLHVCYRVNSIFCLFWVVFFFNVIFFSFSLFIIILYNMIHARMFFFLKERLVIHPSSHPFIHFSI